MSKKEVKEEGIRIKNSLNLLLKKFKLDINFILQPFSENAIKKLGGDPLLATERSNREIEDKLTFILYYNTAKTKELTNGVLKRHMLHEIIHALCWGYTDEYNQVLKYVTDKNLKCELDHRGYQLRENITYLLERKFGPFLIPEACWDEDKG